MAKGTERVYPLPIGVEVGWVAALFLTLFKDAMMMSAEALGVLILGEKRPLT
jgi:hypothetical protein